MRSLRQVWDQFSSRQVEGLSPSEVEQSRHSFGLNRLTPLPREPAWRKFLEKFDDPIIKILLAASVLKIGIDLFDLSFLAGIISLSVILMSLTGAILLRLASWIPTLLFATAGLMFAVTLGYGEPSVEGLAVMVAIGLATGVSFYSEYRSDQEFEALNANKEAALVKVVRSGQLEAVPVEAVVVGDRVRLEAGDEIPADGRVVRSEGLKLDQSLMTGEAERVAKRPASEVEEADAPDNPGCVYRGTQVVEGLGEFVVTNVGDDTMIGQIARRLAGVADPVETPHTNTNERIQQKLTINKDSTPLQERLERLAGLISKVGYTAAVLIFLALLIRGAFFATPQEVFWPTDAAQFKKLFSNLLGYFVYMVIIIVVAVPEGLPMSVTVSLALAMRKMTRANALVRQLVACETIGSVTVICTDKTGTLTQNCMQVDLLSLAGELTPATLATHLHSSAALAAIARNIARNTTAQLQWVDGQPRVVGNSTEGALLHFLHRLPEPNQQAANQGQIVHRVAFSSERKRMLTIIDDSAAAKVVLLKGAPELILARCSHQLLHDGQVVPLTAEAKSQIEAQLAQAARQAMRTLAFAEKRVPPELFADDWLTQLDQLESGLVLTGFVGIRDPLRPDAKQAIQECRSAGIEVKMITGDNVLTARAIADELGLLEAGSVCLTSEEFERLNDDELKTLLPKLRVLARAKPQDKYRMVQLLQELNEVVAMTGDGTNDAPSLKKADVGLAMGIAGTEVAKEASQLVLLDDAFSTIVRAIHWGRALYENIQRFVQFQLTINVSALLIAFLAPLLLGYEPPFTVLQLLWINVIMDTFAAIALCSEPPRPGLMKQQPKRRDADIITSAMRSNILITASFFVAVMLGMLYLMGGSPIKPGWLADLNPSSLWLARDGADKLRVSASELQPLPTGEWATLSEGHASRGWDVHFTLHQTAIFFTVFVMFQVWNQFNCRSLRPTESAFYQLHQNHYFVLIVFLIIGVQFLIITYGGKIFDVEPLHWQEWLVIILATSSVLIFGELSRIVRRFLVFSESRHALGT